MKGNQLLSFLFTIPSGPSGPSGQTSEVLIDIKKFSNLFLALYLYMKESYKMHTHLLSY